MSMQPFRFSSLIALLSLAFVGSVFGQEATFATGAKTAKPLPFPKEFDPAKYLGKWYEIARLPSPSQPGKTLATAEYSQGKNDGEIVVKNTAYDTKGKPVRTIIGKAKLLSGAPPRLAVSFGQVLTEEANYYVMHVNKKYDVAVVGNLGRKSLWILSRKPNLGKKRLDRMVRIAKKADFDTDKLMISDWKSALAHTSEPKFDANQVLGTWKYVSGEKNGVDLNEDHFKDQEIVITKDAMTLKSLQSNFVMNYEFTENTLPQAVKLTIEKSPFGSGQTTNGIIELNKDTLKLCYPPKGGDSPTKFDGKAGSDQHYFVLKRVPEKLTEKEMVGVWIYVSGEMGGRKLDKDHFRGSQVEITKDTLTLKSGYATFLIEYKLDSTKNPAVLDLKIVEGPFGQGSIAPGIAQFKDGKLFICYHPRGGNAPTTFEADAGHSLFILSRVDTK
jgi:apolipoprotein D and lipocalin family protein